VGRVGVRRTLRELERVPDEVGVFDDLPALVVVAQHHHLVPQFLASAPDPLGPLRFGQLAIRSGKLL